jgi:hypothetical protein
MGHHFAVPVCLADASQLPIVKQFSMAGFAAGGGLADRTVAAAPVSPCSSVWSMTDCSFSDLPGHVVRDCGRGRAVEGQARRQRQPGGRLEAVTQLDRGQRVESEILKRRVGVDVFGGRVTQHRGRLQTHCPGQDLVLFGWRQPVEAVGQRRACDRLHPVSFSVPGRPPALGSYLRQLPASIGSVTPVM